MEGFKVKSLHTEAMQKAELEAMLGDGRITLTLGLLERLYLAKSPYVLGGAVEDGDLQVAMGIIPHKRMDAVRFHLQLIDALATAFRAFEIIVPEPEKEDGRKSIVETFSPEWLADIINLACSAMPSLTYRQVLWEMPLAMTLHLSVAKGRENGMVTERPADIKSALEAMKKGVNQA